MIFSKIRFYKLSDDFSIDEKSLSDSISPFIFKKIDKNQVSSHGFVNPFTQYPDKPVYGVGDGFLLTIREDSKPIPASALKRKVSFRIKELEKSKGGDKATKDEKQDIKEQVISEILSAFPPDFIKTKFIEFLVFPKQKLIALNSTSAKDCEFALSVMRGALGSLSAFEFEPVGIPSTIMTSWLQDGESVPDEFSVLDECQLRDSGDEKGAVAHCKKQDLASDEVTGHIDAGKEVIMLYVEWNDSLRFKLKSDLTIASISYTDVLKETLKTDSGDGKAIQKFDADLALISGNIKMLAPSLLKAFA